VPSSPSSSSSSSSSSRGKGKGKGSNSSSNASTPQRPKNSFWSKEMQSRLSLHDPLQFPALPPPSVQRQVVFVCRNSDEISVAVAANAEEPAYRGIHKLVSLNPVLRSALSFGREYTLKGQLLQPAHRSFASLVSSFVSSLIINCCCFFLRL